jgi:hypothetical protein
MDERRRVTKAGSTAADVVEVVIVYSVPAGQ